MKVLVNLCAQKTKCLKLLAQSMYVVVVFPLMNTDWSGVYNLVDTPYLSKDRTFSHIVMQQPEES